MECPPFNMIWSCETCAWQCCVINSKAVIIPAIPAAAFSAHCLLSQSHMVAAAKLFQSRERVDNSVASPTLFETPCVFNKFYGWRIVTSPSVSDWPFEPVLFDQRTIFLFHLMNLLRLYYRWYRRHHQLHLDMPQQNTCPSPITKPSTPASTV